MTAVRSFNTRGPSKLYLKLIFWKKIFPSWGQAGGGRRKKYFQGASFSRSVYSITLLKSSETHMTSHELGREGLVHGCSEIVNEAFCFYILTSAFLWLRISKVFANTKDRSRNLMKALMICKLVYGLVTLSFTSFNIILKLKN